MRLCRGDIDWIAILGGGSAAWIILCILLGFGCGTAQAEDLTVREAAKATLLAPAAPPGSAHLCDVYSMKAGPVSVSVPTYPCEVLRTYATLEDIEDRNGFLVSSARLFLKIRLFTRGVFSSVAGLFGLG